MTIGEQKEKEQSYAPEIQGKIEELQRDIRTLKARVPKDCTWFEREVKQKYNELYWNKKREVEQFTTKYGRSISDSDREELKQFEWILKGSLYDLFNDECAYVLDQITHRRITPYQVETVLTYGSFRAGVSRESWIARLWAAPDSMLVKMAALVIWQWVHTLRNTAKEPPKPIPSTFLLPIDNVDKTDIEGKAYYLPTDPATGIPIANYDPASISQTEQAIHARKKKYQGPYATAEQHAKSEAALAKRMEKGAAEYMEKKNRQRQDACKLREEAEKVGIARFERESEIEEKARVERAQKLKRASGGK